MHKLIKALPIVILIATGCRNDRSRFVKQTNVADRTDVVQQTFIGGYVNPTVFAATSVGDDSGRAYIQIDDMRFPVNADRTFAYKASLWPWGTLTYELDPQVKNNAFWASQFVQACQILTSTTGVGCIEHCSSL
jgi:hypothetical protein